MVNTASKRWLIPLAMSLLAVAMGSGYFFLQQAGKSGSHRGAEAGKVINLKGRVLAASYESTRALREGDPIYEGEQISTSPHGRLQAKMVDEATVALGEKTRFKIHDYAWSDEKKDGSAVLSISKGFFRVVTGKIGKLQRDRKPFKVHTPVATLGVRGTDFWARVPEEGGLDMICLQPTCVVANKQPEPAP